MLDRRRERREIPPAIRIRDSTSRTGGDLASGIDLTPGGTGFIIVTFVIGLLLGVVVKRVFKLAVAIVALVVLLIVTGYINVSQDELTKQTILRAASLQPTIVSTASQAATLFPITSLAFLAGVGLGLWKG